MKVDLLPKALMLSERLKHIFIATTDSTGLPHMATAGSLSAVSDDHISVGAWFCPGTVENLHQNSRIAIVVWESDPDRGYQLVGEVEEFIESSFLNGFVPELVDTPPMPQVERKLLIRVDKVMVFANAPHNDLEQEWAPVTDSKLKESTMEENILFSEEDLGC